MLVLFNSAVLNFSSVLKTVKLFKGQIIDVVVFLALFSVQMVIVEKVRCDFQCLCGRQQC